ncbi:MAG: hypothetical protein WC867_04950 [Candidatus Pacearchaeota archaeon]|jgi:hypothetical protein
MDLVDLISGNNCLKDVMEQVKKLDVKLTFVDVYNSDFKVLHAQTDYAVIWGSDSRESLILPYGGSLAYKIASK